MNTATVSPAETSALSTQHSALSSKARLIVLDIETAPVQSDRIKTRVIQEAISREPASNTRKDLKDAWNTTEAREARGHEAWLKTAVDPLLAVPLCVCVHLDFPNGQPWQLYTFDFMSDPSQPSDPSEKSDPSDSLSTLAMSLDNFAGPASIWIGHNVLGFDLPILLNAWRRAAIKPPAHFPAYGNGRFLGRVYDTMLRTPGKTPFVSLNDAAEAYGLGPIKTTMFCGVPMDGSRVFDAFQAGHFQEILDYCANDVLATRELYLVMTAQDTWGTYDTQDLLTDQLREIEESGHPESTQALAKLRVLENAGLIPRHA